MTKPKHTVIRSSLANYQLIEIIGEGGGGSVYRATTDAGEIVAVKILSPSLAKSSRAQRFKNEVNFGSKIHHPNVMAVLDFGVCEINGSATLFYVMPFFKTSLRGVMKKGIAPADTVRLFSGLLSALSISHERAVWHRDVKPENIMFDESSSRLILCDFGIAHFAQEELWTAVETRADDRLANFQYAAPEQRIRSGIVDHRADIFASGLILNEMFTGGLAHGTGFKRIADASPAHEYLDAVVDRMIRMHAEDRYQSAQAAMEDIEVLSTGSSLRRGRGLGQRAATAARKDDLFWSDEGVKSCRESVDVISSRVLAIMRRCSEESPELKIQVERAPDEIVVRTHRASAQVSWYQPFSNTLSEARLMMWTYRGSRLLPSERGSHILASAPEELSELSFMPDLSGDGLCWRDAAGKMLSPSQTADAVVNTFWDALEASMQSVDND